MSNFFFVFESTLFLFLRRFEGKFKKEKDAGGSVGGGKDFYISPTQGKISQDSPPHLFFGRSREKKSGEIFAA